MIWHGQGIAAAARLQRALWSVVAIACLIGATALAEDERVMGASLIEDAPPMETVFPMLMGLPLAQSEIDFFLDRLTTIETWADAHPEEWQAVNVADDPLKSTLALPLWADAGMTGAEFFTLFVKLQTVHKVAGGTLSVAMLEEQLQTYTVLAGSEELDAASRAEAKLRLHLHQEMLSALKDYPAENIALYTANKERLLPAFARLAAMGALPEDAAKPAGPAPATPPDPAQP